MSELSKELPDQIFIPLGRKGFHPINIKACIRCSMQQKFVLEFIEKIEHPIEENEGAKKKVADYKVKCKNCNAVYYIRMIKIVRIIDGNEEPMVTNFNIL
ncbi:MAG: hypothetical protein ACTSPQ_17630, partial [Candidatus Helarchaeota archaeon]